MKKLGCLGGSLGCLIVPVVLLVVLGVVGFGLYNYANRLQMQAVSYETTLSAQYQDNQNELSQYISSFYEQVGVANLKSDKMDQILLDAVKGRYEGHTSAQPGQGQLFSAITEAYPNLDLSIYDKILEFIQKGRKEYQGYQTKLLNELKDYDQWRQSGLLQSQLLKWGGVPTHALRAQIGTNAVFGEDALKQMYVIVTTSDTQKAYQTGTQDPLQVPGGGVNRGNNPAPTNTPSK